MLKRTTRWENGFVEPNVVDPGRYCAGRACSRYIGNAADMTIMHAYHGNVDVLTKPIQ